MAAKSSGKGSYSKSARTGRFVSPKTAARRPSTTYTSSRKKGK